MSRSSRSFARQRAIGTVVFCCIDCCRNRLFGSAVKCFYTDLSSLSVERMAELAKTRTRTPSQVALDLNDLAQVRSPGQTCHHPLLFFNAQVSECSVFVSVLLWCSVCTLHTPEDVDHFVRGWDSVRAFG